MGLLLLLPSFLSAQTVIDTDTTWSAGPVSITEDTTVSPGVTLTIDPGVTVEFGADLDLVVQGELVARGTEAEPILFTGVDRWGSVVFEDTSTPAVFENLDDYLSGSIVEHCIFENATKALQLVGASPYVHKSIFRDNQCESSGPPEGGAAIYTLNSSTRIEGCTFSNNTAGGVAQGGALFIDSSAVIIQDNTFTQNRSGYGGALTTLLVASPIVGNTFDDNNSSWEGGAASFVSSIPPFLNNTVTNNGAFRDGGGVHVCTTCYPHANPFFMDNTITDNFSDYEGAAGVGAAYIRIFSNNNIHSNLRAQEPADFGWFNKVEDGYPGWVRNPAIPGNWWGTTEERDIGKTIFDGKDEREYGEVFFLPIRTEPVSAPETRVIISTLKIRYRTADEPMPVHLTIYNPGPQREVDLAVLLQYEQSPPIHYHGGIDFPGAVAGQETVRLTLPQNSAYFTTFMEPSYPGTEDLGYGFWHAALFDASSGERIGDVCTIRFEFGEWEE
jgi:hypothetical protein